MMMNKEFEEEVQRFVEDKLRTKDGSDVTFDNNSLELYVELFKELSAKPAVPDFNLPDDLVRILLAREAGRGVVRYYIYVLTIVITGCMLFILALAVLGNPLLGQVFQYVKTRVSIFIFIAICVLFIQVADKFLLKRNHNMA